MPDKVTDYTELAFPTFVNHFTMQIGRSHPEWIQGFAETLAQIQKDVAVAHARGIEAALGDPDVSEAGLAKSIRAVKLAALKRIGEFGASLVDPLRGRIASLEADLHKRTDFHPPVEPGARLAFEFERNRFLAPLTALNPLQRSEVYVRLTDPELLYFMESAKPTVRIPDDPSLSGGVVSEPFVDPELMLDVRAKRIREALPVEAAELEDFQILLGFYSTFLNSIRTLVEQDMPSEPQPTAAKPRTGNLVVDEGFIQPAGSAGGFARA